MLRPCREATEAKPAQNLAHSSLRKPHTKPCLDAACEIDTTPTHHTVLAQIRTFAHHLSHQLCLVGRQTWFGTTTAGLVRQAVQTELIVAMHPVAQGLPVHPAKSRRIGPRPTFTHNGQCKHPPRSIAIHTRRRGLAKRRRCVIWRCKLDRRTHDHVPHKTQGANHRARGRGNPE
jgi:hypothetical protein